MSAISDSRTSVQHVEHYLAGAVSRTVSEQLEQILSPEELTEALDRAVVQGIETALSDQAERFAIQVLGAERSQRAQNRSGYRSGTRTRRLTTPLGTVEVKLVKSRRGVIRPPFLADRGRFASGVAEIARRLWIHGLSTRTISKLGRDGVGGEVSHTTVAEWIQEATDDVLRWLNRPLRKDIAYLVLDGLYVSVKRESARSEVVLVAMGVTADGHKEILDVLVAPSESLDAWGSFLARLRGRGLCPERLRLVVTDGNEGLMRAVDAELPGVRRQRCTVHKVRNVVGKCPKPLKGVAPAEASAIWKAPTRAEARERARAFIARYRESQPVLAAIIEDDLEATLTFYDLDADRWPTMRSTNVLERTNRELKRRFREIGALNGDHAATRVAVLMAMRLNDDWKDELVKGFKKPKRRNARSNS